MLQREELFAIRQSSIRLEDVDCPKITCLGLARTYPLHKAAKLDRRQGKVDVVGQGSIFQNGCVSKLWALDGS